MLAAITGALSANNSSGLASLGSKLRDGSVLARELPLVGTAIGTRFDPAAALSAVFGQLSGSFGNVSQLANALDAIPGVDIPQAPLDTANQLEIRLHLTKQQTITAPLDDAFGSLHLDLNGAVDISIGLDFQISIGAIYSGTAATFYVDATSDQLVVNASVVVPHLNATARLGFTDISLANGVAQLGARFAIDLLDPSVGSEGAGRVTLAEIAATSVSSLLATQIQATSGPSLAADISSTLIPGSKHLALNWSDINSLSSVTTNLDTLGSYDQLEALSASVVSSGLSSLAGWFGAVGGSQSLLARPLPIVGTRLRDALDLANLFKSRFVDQVGSFTSAQSLASRLSGVGDLHNLVTQLVGNELTYRLDLSTQISKGINIDLGLDNLLDLELDADSLNLQASVAASITFGVDLTTETFFLADDGPQPELRVNAAIDVSGLSAGVHVGFLSATASNGSIHFAANASLDAADPSGDHRISASDLASGAANIGSFVTMALTGNANAQMTLDAPLVGITAKNFYAQWPDITNPATLTTNAGDFLDLNSYKEIAAAQFSFGLKQLAQSLVTFVEDPHGGNNPLLIPLPLVKKSIADLVDLDTVLRDNLTKYTDAVQDQVTGALSQPFETSQQLLDLLKNLPGSGPNKASEKVENSDLKYTLQLDKTIQETFPFQLDVASALDLQVSGSITINLAVHTDVTFGVNKDTRIFFIAEQANPVFTADTTTTLNLTGDSRLGFLGISLPGATANLNAHLALRLTDTGADDFPIVVPAVGIDPPASPGKITATELLVGPLSDIVHADFSGNAAAMLPLVASLGDYSKSGTITATWADITKPSTFVLDTSQIQDMLKFQSITPDMILAGLKALPGLLRQMAGSSGLATSLPVLGTNAQGLITLADQLNQLLTVLSQFDTAQKLQQALQTTLAPLLKPATIDVHVSGNDIQFAVHFHQDIAAPALGFNISQQIPNTSVGIQAGGQIVATGSVDIGVTLGVSFDVNAAAGDRFYIVTGNDPNAPVSQAKLNLLIQTTQPLTAAATFGDALVQISSGSLSLSSTTASTPPTPASLGVALRDPGATPDGRITLNELQSQLAGVLAPPTIDGELKAVLTIDPQTLPPPAGHDPLAFNLDWQWRQLSDLANPPTITAPELQAYLDQASHFDINTILYGLQLLINALSQMQNSPVLNVHLPLVNKTPAQLLPALQKILAFFQQVRSDTSSSTTASGFDTYLLNTAVQRAGFSSSEVSVTAGSPNHPDNPATGQLDYVIHLNFAAAPNPLDFDLGLGGNLLSLNTQLTPTVSFTGQIEFGINPLQGFYLVDAGTSPELHLNAHLGATLNAAGQFGPLALNYGVLNGNAQLDASFDVNLVSSPGSNGITPISQLITNFQDAVQPKASGTADLDLPLGLRIGDDGPGVKSDFQAHWDAKDAGNLHYGALPSGGDRTALSTDPTDGFSSVTFELGEWLGKVVGPVLNKVKTYNPLPADLIDVMLKPLPILNVTPLDVLLTAGDLPQQVKLVFEIAQLVNQFGTLGSDTNLELDLSAYHMGAAAPAHPSSGSTTGGTGAQDGLGGFLDHLHTDYGITLPFYDDLTGAVIKTVMGQPIDLIRWNPPAFKVEKDYNIEFPIVGYGIPFLADVSVSGFITGGFGFFANVDLGLSTRGLVKHVVGNNAVQDLLNGFFIGDNKPNAPGGQDGLEVGFFSQVTAGIAGTVHVLGFDAAQIYGGGRITGEIGLDLADLDHDTNNNPVRVGQTDHGGDNRIYLDEIQTLLQSYPIDCVLTLSGDLTASLVVGVKALCMPLGGPCLFDKSASVDFVIADWTLPCAAPDLATLATLQGNTLAMIADALPSVGDIYRLPPAGTPGTYTQGTVSAVSAADKTITLTNATRYVAVTDPNTQQTTYQAVPLSEPVTINEPRLAENNRTSLFIHYDANNQPQSLRIQRLNNQTTSYQDFPLSTLSGVNTLVVEGTPGNDVIQIDPSVSELIPSLTHITVNAGYGDDKIDFGQIDSTKSHLISTTIDAGPGNDTVLGTFAADKILGGDGNDTLSGEGGDDEIHGGDGNDEIDGGPGNDLLYGDDGADTIAGQAGDNRMFGGRGDDTILGSDGNDYIEGDGTDPLYPTNVIIVPRLAGGSDLILAGGGNDIVHGGPGNDQIFGGSGNDFLYGEDGSDEIHGDEGDDYLQADQPGSVTTALGGAGNDAIDGGDGYDVLVQTVNADQTLTDTTLTGQGADTWQDIEQIHLTGGSAANVFNVSGFTGTAFLDGGSGSDTVLSSGDFDYTLSNWNLTRSDGASFNLTSIEQASLSGGTGDSTFDVTRWTGTATLSGGGGLDTVRAQNDADFLLTDTALTRSSGGSFTLAAIGRAELTGGIGNNVIDASAFSGQAILVGGEGDDVLRGGSGDDSLDGGLGTDQLFGNAGRDNLVAGGGAGDMLDGGDGDDTLIGSDDGGDILRGGPGRDRLSGNGGNDQLFGGAGDDILDGGAGDDTLSGDGGSDLLIGGAGNDVLYGQNVDGSGDDNAPDTLYGDFGTNGNEAGSGRDRLYGQGGNDRLFGEGDDDLLDGGTGTDDRLDYGGGEGANPADFVPPAAASPPTPQPPTGISAAAGSLPVGILQPGRWTELFGSATGLGLSGSTSQAIEPAVIADASGPIVAWADNRNGNFEIYVARQSASGWQQLALSAQDGGISSTAGDSRRPSIALDAAGNPIAAWTEFNGASSDIRVADYRPAANGGAGGWVALGSSLSGGGISGTGAADDVQLVVTSSGPVVAWTDRSTGVANVYVRQFSGSQWIALGTGSASGGGISASASDVLDLTLATDGAKVAAAWTQTVAGLGQIYLREYSGGSWQELAGSASAGGVSNTAGDSAAATLAYSGGSLLAAWQDSTSGHTEIYSARYTGTSWSPAGNGAASGSGVSSTKGLATQPRLAAGGGKLELLWTEERTANFTGNGTALYAKRWNGTDFVEELPGDASFSGIAGSEAIPQLAAVTVDSAGHPFVAWQDLSAGGPEILVRGNRFDVNHVYYVNDGSVVGDSITTATGAATNSGTSPSLPKPSVQAVLDAYTLGQGDVILVDAGSYASGFTLSASDSGVAVLGSPALTTSISGPVLIESAATAALFRLNLAAPVTIHGSTSITLAGNSIGGGVTIDGGSSDVIAHNRFAVAGAAISVVGATVNPAVESNTIIGGSLAVSPIGVSRLLRQSSAAAQGIVVGAAGATNLWIHGNQFSDVGSGIVLGTAASGQIVGNRVAALTTGIAINASFVGPIAGNEVQGASIGVRYAAATDLSNNRIHDNQTGVVATVAGSGGLGFVGSGVTNQIYANGIGVQLTGQMQNQHVFANAIGVTGSGILGGTDLDHANLIERNTTGVSFAGAVEFNRINRNAVGISASNQTIDHNLIYRNTSAGVRIVGGNVEVLQNTFYTTQGNGLELPSPAGQVEVENNVFWADGGYDVWLGGDIRGSFFSDYNDLYAEGGGLLVHWLKDFADVLDWQDDVARWDLHSIGRTVVNPQWAQPQFANLARDDFRIGGLAAGLRLSSRTMDAGDPRLDLVLAGGQQNLLANPSFESGLTSWNTNAGAAASNAVPGAFDGTSYFAAGAAVLGFAEQTIDLTAQFSPSQLDSQDLVVVFGGRIRAAAETPPDRGRLLLTFQDGAGQQLSQTIATATNASGRWELVGDRITIPVGARRVVYRFETARISGSTNDAWLDHAFVYIRPETAAPDQGAYGNASTDADLTNAHLALRTPDLYIDWERDKPQTIRWDSFGNAIDAPVNINLLADSPNGPQLLTTLAASAPDIGAFTWTPANFGVDYGTHNLRIEISLVGNPAVFDRSQEAFAVPENTNSFYVNDGAATGDEFATALGSNRNTGKLSSAPKPYPNNVLRTYSLGAGQTLNVDTGEYSLFDPIVLSGTAGIGDDEGFMLSGPTSATHLATLRHALPAQSAPLIDLNDADLMTIAHLTLADAGYGLLVHNGSVDLAASYLTIAGSTLDGVHLDTGSTATALDHLAVSDSSRYGIYVDGPLGALTNTTVTRSGAAGAMLSNTGGTLIDNLQSSDNGADGLDLSSVGAAHVQRSQFATNRGHGLAISGNGAIVGATDLSLGLGNIVHDNGQNGIDASGNVIVAGNTVFGQTAFGAAGINAGDPAVVTHNVVHHNSNGIISNGPVIENRTYANASAGIVLFLGGVAQGNVSYSNATGIQSGVGGYGNGSQIVGNLVYANSAQGIWFFPTYASSGVNVTNNTVYQPAGDAVRFDAGSSNLRLRNNILVVSAGYALDVANASPVGFQSDFNDFLVSGTGKVALWQGVARPTLAAWQNTNFTDQSSLAHDPLFVDFDGADNALGYASATSDGRDDDFHLQSKFGSFHGGALAPAISAATGLPTTLFPVETIDANQSPAIDRGDPADSPANEPLPNGGYVNLGAYGNTAQASKSPSQYVLVTTPDGGESWPQERSFTIRWRSQDSVSSVNIDLLKASDQTLATHIAAGAPNSGQFAWTVPDAVTPSSQYLIRVARTDNGLSDASNAPFTITPPIHTYYVNDDTVNATGDWTTAPGNDANDGLTPATPKASIRAVLQAYSPGAGDTILVDAGNYALASNLIIPAANSGVRIEGYHDPAFPSRAAILDRGNQSAGSYTVELQNADDVTLSHLSLTGGYYPVYAANASDSDRLTISDCDIYGNLGGIDLEASNDDAVITSSRIHDLIHFGARGIIVVGARATVSGNTVVDKMDQYGISLSGSQDVATGNNVSGGVVGILAGNGGSPTDQIIVRQNVVHDAYQTEILVVDNVLVTGNEVYSPAVTTATGIDVQGRSEASSNLAHDNSIGMSAGGLVHDDRVYHNTQIGILTGASGIVRNNVVYSNAIGVRDYFDGYYNNAQVLNNLIYANSTAGIIAATPYSDGSPTITGNTVYQPAGDALKILGGSPNIHLKDNILWAQSGYDIIVPSDSEVGFTSDYNDLVTTGTGKLGQWEGRDFITQSDWFYELGFDAHSQAAIPLFVNPAGADGILGYNTAASTDGGLDDNFHLQTGSPAIDAGDPADSFFNEPSPNGGRINLGNYGNTTEATTSLPQTVQVLSPNGLDKFEVGQPVSMSWRSSGLPAGTSVAIDSSLDNGLTWSNLVSGQVPNSSGGGTFVWTPAITTVGNSALIRVRADSLGAPTDVSDAGFLIANAGHDYYINDASTVGDVFTTASGDNANSGKSPDQPMASLAALLALYDLDPRDVIHVDTGTHRLVRNVVLTSQDSGVRIEGPATAAAVVDRGNQSAGSYTIELQGATAVTLNHLSLTGGYNGVYAADNAGAAQLTVSNSEIYGNSAAGISLGATNDDAVLIGNRIHNQTGFFANGIVVSAARVTISGNTLYQSGTNGIYVRGADDTVTGNETYQQATGISANYDGDPAHRIVIRNNLVHDNASTGIDAQNSVLVIGNTVFGQLNSNARGISNDGGNTEITGNMIHDNDMGMSVAALAHDNRVYHNTRIGIQTGASGIVRNNAVYSNAIGIKDYFDGYYNNALVANNLVYANSDAGIVVATPYGSGSPIITSNTVYQPAGDAIRILGGSPNVHLKNNILWVQSGYDIIVPADSEVGFQSDYNDLVTTGTGKLGQWEGRDFTRRSDWFYELGFDAHSQTSIPLFVNLTGADGLLGYASGADHGADDDFHLQAGSPAIDAGDPADTYFNEPSPNGDRINLGSYGDTAQATTSAAQSVQVLSPNGLEKFEVGQSVLVQWRSAGLTPSRPVVSINAGGPEYQNWMADSFQSIAAQTGTITDSIDTSGVADPASAVIYQSYAVNGGPPGGHLSYQLPVPDGSYQLRLDLVAPSDTTPGSRVMDIYVQGSLAKQDYDLFAHTGGALKAAAETFYATASGGSGISLDLINKTYGGAIIAGIEVTALNPAGVASPTVDLDLSTDGGGHWTTLATGLILDHFGQGSYLWTAGPETSGNTALFRVRAYDGSQPSDTSDAPFLIANAGHDYYVNDGTTTGDVFTTSIGDNINSGKSPAAPIASVAALLAAYDLDPGDIVHVDTGTYHLARNITVTSQDSGVRINGPATVPAILDRGNQSGGSYVIELQNADDVTLSRLGITGGSYPAYAANGSDSDRLTISDCDIYGNVTGIDLEASNDDAVITNNHIHDLTHFGATGILVGGARATVSGNAIVGNLDQYGISLSGSQDTATGNDVSGGAVGINAGNGGGKENQITVQANTVHDNNRVGIQGSDNVLITGNRVFGQQLDSSATGISVFGNAQIVGNVVFNNKYGITTASRASGNRVYHNSVIGILTGLSGVVDGNYVYSNPIGIQSGIGGYYNSAQILNNLVYANANQGILIGRTYAAAGVSVVNNTVYQPVGDAILLDGDTSNLTLRNNILWIDGGYAIHATTSNHTGFSSDYNLFQQVASPGALIGFWTGVDQTSLANWQTASGQDAHSLLADAGFVDINGADNVLGYDATGNGYDGGLDDNFYARKNSNTIDRGDPAPATATDIEGRPRVDDPGSPNLGPSAAIIDLGAYEFRGSSLDTTPPTVVATNPAAIQSGDIAARFGQFTITFSEGVNPIDARAAASYELRSSGPNGLFDDGDDVLFPLVAQYTDGLTVTLGVSVIGGLVPIGNYRLTVFSSATKSIHDLAGLALDGNADGVEQGSYVRAFSVITPNQAPSFIQGPDQSTTDEAGPQTIAAWATAILPGPAAESGQAVTFIVTTDNDALFAAGPAIDASSGSLTFTPAPNAHGVAHITVGLKDNGGTIAGGIDTSSAQTFTITIDKPHLWHNTQSADDVDGDGHIAPIDALIIINDINAFGSRQIPVSASLGPPYYDVDNDGFIAPIDALLVINLINSGQGSEGEDPFATLVPLNDHLASQSPLNLGELLDLLAIDLAQRTSRRRVL